MHDNQTFGADFGACQLLEMYFTLFSVISITRVDVRSSIPSHVMSIMFNSISATCNTGLFSVHFQDEQIKYCILILYALSVSLDDRFCFV